MNQKKLIDHSALEQFDVLQIKGEPNILIEVIDSFLKSSPPRFVAIAKFIETRNVEGVAREAHLLKPVAQMLGACLVGELCLKLEQPSDADKIEDVEKLFQALKEAYDQSAIELLEFRNKM